MNKLGGIINITPETRVDLVRYGAAANNQITGTKKFPILGLDLSRRPDIAELIRIQEQTPPGDVETQWSASRSNKKLLFLSFKYERPTRTCFYIPLYFDEHSWIIEGLLQSQAAFLKPAQRNEATEDMLHGLNESLTVEIGAKHDIPVDWRAWQEKALLKKIRLTGLRKKEALKEARSLILSHKKFWSSHVDFHCE